MKKILLFSFCILFTLNLYSQNGKIVHREEIKITESDDLKNIIFENEGGSKALKEQYQYLEKVRIERIKYLSDGLKVIAYMVTPLQPGKYPGIIYNRGGNKEFGKITPQKVAFILAQMASWGYVVSASQYRGVDGGEGMEEFGGADVHDVLNLIPIMQNHKMVLPDKLGIYGWSRGGMMTYLALMKTDVFRAAVVGGGLSDLQMMKDTRPVMEEVYIDLIPGYSENKDDLLDERSAIKNVEKITKTTPILMLHGTSDWRVVPQMALDLAEAFTQEKIPYRLLMLEGGDHGLTEFRKVVNLEVKMWLDKYVKERSPLPDLNPHGR